MPNSYLGQVYSSVATKAAMKAWGPPSFRIEVFKLIQKSFGFGLEACPRPGCLINQAHRDGLIDPFVDGHLFGDRVDRPRTL